MVNASSTLATAPGAAASAGIAEPGAPDVKRTARRRAVAAAPAPAAWNGARSLAQLVLDPAAVTSLARALGAVLPGGGRAAVAGWARAPRAATTTSRSSASSTPSSKSALSFLSDPKLSVEEKLMRLMAYLNGKWEKEMEAKMKQVAGEDGKATSSSGSSTKKKGLLGSVASAVSSFVGRDALKAVSGFLKLPGVKAAIGKVAGPVLAAGASALGFPAAAPALLAYGPRLVDAAAGVVSAAASSPSSGTSTASGKELSDSERQLLMTQIQRLQDKQKEMFGLVSNILKGNHDTRMATINNIR